MNDEVYFTGPDIRRRFKITAMTLHRWLRRDDLDFPKPIMIAGRRYFRIADVEKWERDRASAAT